MAVTFISTAPDGEADYLRPDGVPDQMISENEAKLWLLSESERRSGDRVVLDDGRWRRAGERVGSECEVCREIFYPSRIDALYCKPACRKRASRRLYVTDKGGSVAQ